MKFFIGLIACLSAMASGANEKAVIRLRNESDDYLSIHWVNPRTQDTAVIKSIVEPREAFQLNSYVTHHIQIWQELDPRTGLCGSGDEGKCDEVSSLQVTESEQAFIIREGVQIETEKILSSRSNYKELIKSIDLQVVEDPENILAACKERATERFNQLDDDDHDHDIIMKEIQDTLHDCMTVGLSPRIKASYDEVEFERSLRLQASHVAENFTCVNTDLESSPDVATEEWVSEKDSIMRMVHKKMDRPASRIHVVANFASAEECKAMEVEAEKDLHVASTADGKGGSKVSPGRKAMQAGIKPRFNPDGTPLDDNPISFLSGRVYEYTNHVLNMNITHHGQEPLMSIQYFGRGRHDIEPDRYTPHCDGRCTGEPHVTGGRMATMVIYCTLPTQGGFTNFQNANVHVRPNSGDAVFFSYFNPLTNITDNGLTQHSGCPVYEGEKKIITQWVRYGVSSETPHNAFNTLTILKSEDGE